MMRSSNPVLLACAVLSLLSFGVLFVLAKAMGAT